MEKYLKIATSALLSAAAISPSLAASSYEFVTGSGALTFSDLSISSLQAAGVTIGAAGLGAYQAPKLTLGVNGTAFTLSADGTSINTLYPLGGFSLSSSTVPGAKIIAEEIKVDPKTGVIKATLRTFDTAGGYKGSLFKDLHVANSTVTGQSIMSENISMVFSNMKFTNEAVPVLADALGVPRFLAEAIFPVLNIGSTTLNATFKLKTIVPTTPVPEPSTLALLSLGLLALAVARARKMNP